MANRPRKHHYVPSFYLAGFTWSGSDEDRLNVFDQGQIKAWSSSPRNAGHSRDFYAIDLGPGIEPTCFESEVLAHVEGEASRVIHTAVKTKRLPEGRDFDVLLSFVALTAARTPRIRRLVGQVTDLFVKASVQSLVATEEGWQQFQSYCRDAGIKQNDDDAEQMRQFSLSGDYEVDLDQTSHVQKIVELMDAMLPLLVQRCWFSVAGRWGSLHLACRTLCVPTSRYQPPRRITLDRRTDCTWPITIGAKRRVVMHKAGNRIR